MGLRMCGEYQSEYQDDGWVRECQSECRGRRMDGYGECQMNIGEIINALLIKQTLTNIVVEKTRSALESKLARPLQAATLSTR